MKQPEDSKTVSGRDSGPEAVMENNTDTNEAQDTLDETVPSGFNDSATNQKTISPCNNNQEEPEDSKTVSGEDSGPEVVMENNIDTNEVEDTLFETVPLGFNDSVTNQKILSPCKNNQEEIQQANVSIPTPTNESQQYLEQNDSSFALVVRYEISFRQNKSIEHIYYKIKIMIKYCFNEFALTSGFGQF